MNNCQQAKGGKQCASIATERLWCPTWLWAEHGPMNLCADCAKNFKPEHNLHLKSGLFFWGEAADSKFHELKNRLFEFRDETKFPYNLIYKDGKLR